MAARPWTEVRQQLQVALRAGAIGALTDGQLLGRFIAKGDGAELAFETLVARHGPMVLSVCKGVLGASHDAEDAFQATFLVLVRQAGTIRNQDSLACWLHGVARRIALRARETAKRARRREVDRARPEGVEIEPDSSELVSSLHEEISRLPEHYRVAVLLCEIGGRTHAEAAAQLRCPVGTVSGRLFRARNLLKERIARRGLVAGSFSLALAGTSARAGFDGVASTRSILASADAPARLATAFLQSQRSSLWRVAAGLLVPLLVTASPTPLGSPATVEPSRAAIVNPAPVVATKKPPVVMNWREEEIIDVTIAPDGKTYAAVRRNASVTIWDLELDRERFTYRGHAAPLTSLVFAPDGGSITSSDAARELKVWTLDSGRERLSLKLPAPGTPGGEPVVAASPCGEVPSGI